MSKSNNRTSARGALCFVLVIASGTMPIACSPGTDAIRAELNVLAQQPTTPQPEGGQAAARIVGRKWQRVRTPAIESSSSEFVTWEFHAGGAFVHELASDFPSSYSGAWSFSPSGESRGVMFLASAGRADVLSVEVAEGELILGERAYRPTSAVRSEETPQIRPEDRTAVGDRAGAAFAPWVTITAADWHRQSAGMPGDPSVYSFATDGTFRAVFTGTRCQFDGTWSTSFSQSGDGLMWLSVPANDCDPRGSRDAFLREVTFRLGKNELILDGQVYVAAARGR